MPRLSQWYVRCAMGHLLAGTTMGALLLAHKGVPFAPGLWRWVTVHMETLLVGWILQLTLGVAFWIAPRRWESGRERRRGAVVAALFLLNGGVLLVATGRLLAPTSWLPLAGRVLEGTALLLFTAHLWDRLVGREG